MRIDATIVVEISEDAMIKQGKRVLKFGDAEMGFVDKELKEILNERLGDGVKVTNLKVDGISG
jgi:hypothetical protein